ncbi:MAG: carbohydrate transporter permease [Bacillota bacterium]|jgi:ABC-type glycerol-3-phosphate transport system permease component|nr:carbohydrate transporter permease [Bacillota bacterium]
MRKKTVLLHSSKVLILLLASLFSLFPFLIMLKSSLEPYTSIVSLDFHMLPQNPSLNNYIDVCKNYPILRWFFNSSFVAATAIVINMVVDIFAAYTLARIEYPGKKATNTMVLCAQIVPVQVIVVPLYLMMVQWNWVDTYRGLILPVAISPFIIFFLKQSFMQIPRALDEAAMIDGCSRVGVLRNVILPNSMPALGTSVVLKFMWIWGDYMWPSLVSKSTEMRTLPVAVATFQRAGGTYPWELIMPAAVLSSIPIILLFLFLQKYFIAGFTDGAVKG